MVAFTVELVFKLIGTGFRNYLKSSFNRFDAIIVAISLTEVVLSFLINSEDVLTVLGLFKALRVLRMLKLTRYNQGMRELLDQMVRSLISIGSFSALLILFLFIFALTGMELFAYRALLSDEGEFISTDEAYLIIKEVGHEGQRSVTYPR